MTTVLVALLIICAVALIAYWFTLESEDDEQWIDDLVEGDEELTMFETSSADALAARTIMDAQDVDVDEIDDAMELSNQVLHAHADLSEVASLIEEDQRLLSLLTSKWPVEALVGAAQMTDWASLVAEYPAELLEIIAERGTNLQFNDEIAESIQAAVMSRRFANIQAVERNGMSDNGDQDFIDETFGPIDND